MSGLQAPNPIPIGMGGTGSVTADAATAALGPVKMSAEQVTTSGTAKDFTGIPAGVKRVTVNFNAVSTNGTSLVQVQIGAGSIEATGYAGASQQGGSPVAYSTGFLVTTVALVGSARSGSLNLVHMGGNKWVCEGCVADTASNWSVANAGIKSLAGVLDRVRVTTVNGTDAFDAGSVNISWEF